jgi:4-amino-4-deoxy-L-arabinose transferase-like glycosyltransferase
MPGINTSKHQEIIFLIFCIIAGFALRLYTFDQKSLWMDEIYTFNDSRYGLKDQLKYYKEKPTYFHPPLFFILTHQFYPFAKPERDLRIIPLFFGTLSIPMIYLLAKQFSASIAIPCTLSLTFMTYHISLSQDGRSYSLLMFLGVAGLYFFLKYLQTLKKHYLLVVAFFFSTLFYTGYSSIPFIVLSQILWFYGPSELRKKSTLISSLTLNGFIILFCLPWILFVAMNYKGQPFVDPAHTENPGSFLSFYYSVFHDWTPYAPLTIISIILSILFPFFSKDKKNAFILLGLFILPIGGLYLYCTSFHITHFVTSRYFISFLPTFLITLYLSLGVIEGKFERLGKFVRLRFLFTVLFIASNLVILPFYYRSEKQDYKGLVNYLKNHLREGDKIFVAPLVVMPGMLHYFGAYPEGRHYAIPLVEDLEKGTEFRMMSFTFGGKIFSMYHSKMCCTQFVDNGARLWIIVVGKWMANRARENSPCVFKGYFDGSFVNLMRFPTDASLYLFLWDPKSSEEKGIDMQIE